MKKKFVNAKIYRNEAATEMIVDNATLCLPTFTFRLRLYIIGTGTRWCFGY